MTRTGRDVHIAEAHADRTRCGWPVDEDAEADDALWFHVCLKCRRDGPAGSLALRFPAP